MSLFDSLMEQYGKPIRPRSEGLDEKRERKRLREPIHLRRDIPYTPQTFTPTEGGVQP